MKKVLIIIALSIICISFCACEKSEDIINVETQIASLNNNSTYKEINEVYKEFRALESKDQKKVENTSVLAEYCDTTNGHFVLTNEMLEEIEENIADGSAEYDVELNLYVNKITKGWSTYGNVDIVSDKQEDDYSYSIYGNFDFKDEYGSSGTRNFELVYYAEYDEETDTCIITDNFYITVASNP